MFRNFAKVGIYFQKLLKKLFNFLNNIFLQKPYCAFCDIN